MKTHFLMLGEKFLKKSRLMHGASLTAMGRLMDRIMPQINHRDKKGDQKYRKDLDLLFPIATGPAEHRQN